ncbi:hypothetical protein AAZV13_16G076400 [Glycine max]
MQIYWRNSNKVYTLHSLFFFIYSVTSQTHVCIGDRQFRTPISRSTTIFLKFEKKIINFILVNFIIYHFFILFPLFRVFLNFCSGPKNIRDRTAFIGHLGLENV